MAFLSAFRGKTTKDIAKERLQFVLTHDRASISPAVVDKIKDEIIDIISKYVTIDPSAIEVELHKVDQNGISTLVANVPILTTRKVK